MIERRLPHLDDFTIHTGLEHAIAVQSTAKMPNLPAQLPVLLLQRKNMRDACEIDTLVLAQLLRLRKTRHVTKRVAPRTALRALRHHQTKAVVLAQRLWMHARNLSRLAHREHRHLHVQAERVDCIEINAAGDQRRGASSIRTTSCAIRAMIIISLTLIIGCGVMVNRPQSLRDDARCRREDYRSAATASA